MRAGAYWPAATRGLAQGVPLRGWEAPVSTERHLQLLPASVGEWQDPQAPGRCFQEAGSSVDHLKTPAMTLLSLPWILGSLGSLGLTSASPPLGIQLVCQFYNSELLQLLLHCLKYEHFP